MIKYVFHYHFPLKTHVFRNTKYQPNGNQVVRQIMMNMYSKMILPKKCQTVTFTQLAVVKRVSYITSTGITSKCIITNIMFRTRIIITLVNTLCTVVALPTRVTVAASIYCVTWLWTRMVWIALTHFWTICSKRPVWAI